MTDLKKVTGIIAFCLATACATARSRSPVVAPTRINLGSAYPIIHAPANPSDNRTGRTDYEIWIDALGNPEAGTFKASGAASEPEAQDLKQWLLGSRFHPAMKAGKPVRGLYKSSIWLRVESTR